jgi:hypothetical protein
LQHQGERPVRGGRPSLLSPDEQAVPEQKGILSSLDGMHGQPRAAQGPRPRSRALAWGVAAVGVVVAGGALFLLGGGEEARPPAVAVAAAPAVTSVAEVPRAAPWTPVSMPAPAASTAAVLHDEPAAPALPEPAAPMANPLAEMAASPAPERHKTHAEKPERKEAHAKAAHRKAHDAAQETARGGKEKRTKPRSAHEQDSDVVLLAALMSHMEPVNRKATPTQQLEACRRYNAAGEEQCRVRVCDAVGRKEAACKRVPAARSEPET